jgi:DNA-binding transcriptional regulator YdaS (Cro superfamily)
MSKSIQNKLEDALVEAGWTKAQLAKHLGVSKGAVSQWDEFAPIKSCVRIETALGGAVTRKDLRPNDWHLIWPELADKQVAGAK